MAWENLRAEIDEEFSFHLAPWDLQTLFLDKAYREKLEGDRARNKDPFRRSAHCERLRKRHQLLKNDPEHREKRRAWKKAHRDRHPERMVEYRQRPEVKARQRKRQAEKYRTDPEYRKKKVEQNRARRKRGVH